MHPYLVIIEHGVYGGLFARGIPEIPRINTVWLAAKKISYERMEELLEAMSCVDTYIIFLFLKIVIAGARRSRGHAGSIVCARIYRRFLHLKAGKRGWWEFNTQMLCYRHIGCRMELS